MSTINSQCIHADLIYRFGFSNDSSNIAQPSTQSRLLLPLRALAMPLCSLSLFLFLPQKFDEPASLLPTSIFCLVKYCKRWYECTCPFRLSFLPGLLFFLFELLLLSPFSFRGTGRKGKAPTLMLDRKTDDIKVQPSWCRGAASLQRSRCLRRLGITTNRFPQRLRIQDSN